MRIPIVTKISQHKYLCTSSYSIESLLLINSLSTYSLRPWHVSSPGLDSGPVANEKLDVAFGHMEHTL